MTSRRRQNSTSTSPTGAFSSSGSTSCLRHSSLGWHSATQSELRWMALHQRRRSLRASRTQHRSRPTSSPSSYSCSTGRSFTMVAPSMLSRSSPTASTSSSRSQTAWSRASQCASCSSGSPSSSRARTSSSRLSTTSPAAPPTETHTSTRSSTGPKIRAPPPHTRSSSSSSPSLSSSQLACSASTLCVHGATAARPLIQSTAGTARHRWRFRPRATSRRPRAAS
mmetsp:Transcript_37023/g.110152  ORF Transcript_37023/g.110152 Transcript_37023/m.110152 type:complete len:224 (-) Transcript_37023:353-1024(-)